jgi:hypothetical protein
MPFLNNSQVHDWQAGKEAIGLSQKFQFNLIQVTQWQPISHPEKQLKSS